MGAGFARDSEGQIVRPVSQKNHAIARGDDGLRLFGPHAVAGQPPAGKIPSVARTWEKGTIARFFNGIVEADLVARGSGPPFPKSRVGGTPEQGCECPMGMNRKAGTGQTRGEISPGVVGGGFQHHETFFFQRPDGIHLVPFSFEGGVGRGRGNF